jgi:hypothetical protein
MERYCCGNTRRERQAEEGAERVFVAQSILSGRILSAGDSYHHIDASKAEAGRQHNFVGSMTKAPLLTGNYG